MEQFWTHTAASLFKQLNTSANGLIEEAVADIQRQQTKQIKVQKPWVKDLLLLRAQYKNPLNYILCH